MEASVTVMVMGWANGPASLAPFWSTWAAKARNGVPEIPVLVSWVRLPAEITAWTEEVKSPAGTVITTVAPSTTAVTLPPAGPIC